VTEKDKDTLQSRRARRRARADQVEDAEPEASEPSEGAEAAAETATVDADRPAKRRKKRSSAEVPPDEDASAADRIRDRNRRIREQAAQARKSKRQDRETGAAQGGLDTGEMVDDALARASHNAYQFVRKHFTIVQWVLVLGVAGGLGWQGYSYYSSRKLEKAADSLMVGVANEDGHVEAAPPGSAAAPTEDLRPRFATREQQLQAATEAYQLATDGSASRGTTILAQLGLAGVLFDQGKYDDALVAYRAVKDSALAKADPDVRCRAIEGVGLCLEAKRDVDGALQAFRELENSETAGFVELGRYHQARLLFAKGDRTRALELVKLVRESLAKGRTEHDRPGFLEIAAAELHRTIDPAATASVAQPAPGEADLERLQEQVRAMQELAARTKGNMSDKELQELIRDPERVQRMLREMGRVPGNLQGAPPAPAPASSK
jgi:hypothetical protein